MRTLARNKQKMMYAIPIGKEHIYETDSEGNIIYAEDEDGNQIPIDTGEERVVYSTPIEFKGTLGSQLEDAITRAWGSDNSNNFAVLILSKNAIDSEGNLINFPNGTVIWRKSEYDIYGDDVYPSDNLYPNDDLVPVNGKTYTDETTADYIVDGIMDEELNETSYYLRKRK